MTDLTDYIDNAQFEDLFIEGLGWDRPTQGGRTVEITSDDGTLEAQEVATAKGISVWACPTVPDGRTQREVDREVRKQSIERLLIFHDGTQQQWKWPQTTDSSGSGSARLVTHEHVVGRSNPALEQRLHLIEIEIDDDPTVIEIHRNLRKAFDADKVTKSFYRTFAAQQGELCEAIEGIDGDDQHQVRWYGSLLMNRLMFIYFMQRKGFLDGDHDYLRTRLNRIQDLSDPDDFYEFYRDFLLPLFHQGLGETPAHRTFDDQTIAELIGDIPYVNGGIFSVHSLEANHDISVPDSAFEEIFDFFDDWRWHLDERPTGDPNEINPDVLGYIFEQFVNHQETAATGSEADQRNPNKGAYYTKEDVTGYMTASVLIPAFLERLEQETGINPWLPLAADPHRYIWDSVTHGLRSDIPNEVAAAAGRFPRPAWDEKPGGAHGLPAESWWEVIDRHRHAENLIARMSAGKVASIRDAITNNLDLETLAVDVIDRIDNPSDLTAAWRILTDLKIIDPTCGSGAFLFAALEILHRLYGATLDGAETHARTKTTPELGDLLDSAREHSGRSYFVLKHAALNNLYGVDIMPEAVEIARLRLFLKLIAQVDRRSAIEPLPDLEFNVRPGNILVGAHDRDSIYDKVGLTNADAVDDVIELAAEAEKAYARFAKAQATDDADEVRDAKQDFIKARDPARERLDSWWHEADADQQDFDEWHTTHTPFHWFIEFPGVMADGGFDVVVGNPPYVATTKIDYTYSGFATDDCEDIYAPCLERAAQITSDTGRLSMITPMNLAWAEGYQALRSMLARRFTAIWATTFDQMPSRLFEGVGTRNTIVIASQDGGGLHTASFNKWPAEFRPHLMNVQHYINHPELPDYWPKVGHGALLDFATSRRKGLGSDSRQTAQAQHRLGYRQTANYWISVFVNDPPRLDKNCNPIEHTKIGNLYFRSDEDRYAALAIAASRVIFLWWVFNYDAFDVTATFFDEMPITVVTLPEDEKAALAEVGRELQERCEAGGEALLWTPYKGWSGNYDLTRCRDLTDKADRLLFPHFDLDTDEAREAFEIEYWNYHKSGGERPGTVRGSNPC